MLEAAPLTAEESATTGFETNTREQYMDDLYSVTDFRIDPNLSQILLYNSFNRVVWLRSKGVRFLPLYWW